MRRAALIYNPSSGRERHLRLHKVEAASAVLRSGGAETTLIATEAAGSAGSQAREAIATGHDTIFACGGDGTIHDVLQGMMDIDNRQVALGIIPLGTGNVLAHDLDLPMDALSAVRAQLNFTPRRIAIGKVDFQGPDRTARSRYFITTAGIGWDAEMLYRVTADLKQRLGLIAYVYEGTKLSLGYGFPPFHAEYSDHNGNKRATEISQVMAVRITNFGSFMRRFAPGAALVRDDMQLVLFRTRNFFRYFSYMLGVALGRNWQVDGVELIHSREITCQLLPEEAANPNARLIYVEADGEYLGKLPARVTVVPDALNLLMKPIY